MTPAVEQQNALIAVLEVVFYVLQKNIGKSRGVAALELRVHIRRYDLRQYGFAVALCQNVERISACFCVVVALYARCGGAEDKQSVALGAAEHRDLARVITRRALRLVAVLLLLVHNDKPDAFKRREHRAARAYHYFCQALFDALVFVKSFAE